MSEPIPVLEVRGTHHEVGRQIGEHMRSALQRRMPQLRERLPTGVTWPDMLLQGRIYLAYSRAVYPQYIDELTGVAQGANLPFEEMFLWMCEGLWDPAAWHGHVPSGTDGNTSMPSKGCTDFAARGRATVDGSTLLAHTNDLGPEDEDDLVILKVQAADEPQFLGVSPGGLAISAGFNAAGIGLTGNHLSCNDIRPGVPRLLIVRAILAARRLEEALAACLLPQRASSYNNVVGDASGEVYSMEGSATDCEPIYIDGDILAHANHYASQHMRRFEVDRDVTAGSIIRHNRAMRLLRESYGRVSVERLQEFLKDHVNYPGSICKHGPTVVTVFSLIIHLEERRAWIGRGRPCQTTYLEYTLEPWTPHQV